MSSMVQQFQDAIGVLFTPSSKPENIHQANRFLMEISEDKQCFGVCVEIISNQNSSIAVKHFSANILYTKVRKQWSQLEESEKHLLINFLSNFIPTLTSYSTDKQYKLFCQCLVHIFAICNLYISSNVLQYVQYAIQFIQNHIQFLTASTYQSNQPSCHEAKSYFQLGLDLLSIFQEEFELVDISRQQKQQIMSIYQSAVVSILPVFQAFQGNINTNTNCIHPELKPELLSSVLKVIYAFVQYPIVTISSSSQTIRCHPVYWMYTQGSYLFPLIYEELFAVSHLGNHPTTATNNTATTSAGKRDSNTTTLAQSIVRSMAPATPTGESTIRPSRDERQAIQCTHFLFLQYLTTTLPTFIQQIQPILTAITTDHHFEEEDRNALLVDQIVGILKETILTFIVYTTKYLDMIITKDPNEAESDEESGHDTDRGPVTASTSPDVPQAAWKDILQQVNSQLVQLCSLPNYGREFILMSMDYWNEIEYLSSIQRQGFLSTYLLPHFYQILLQQCMYTLTTSTSTGMFQREDRKCIPSLLIYETKEHSRRVQWLQFEYDRTDSQEIFLELRDTRVGITELLTLCYEALCPVPTNAFLTSITAGKEEDMIYSGLLQRYTLSFHQKASSEYDCVDYLEQLLHHYTTTSNSKQQPGQGQVSEDAWTYLEIVLYTLHGLADSMKSTLFSSSTIQQKHSKQPGHQQHPGKVMVLQKAKERLLRFLFHVLSTSLEYISDTLLDTSNSGHSPRGVLVVYQRIFEYITLYHYLLTSEQIDSISLTSFTTTTTSGNMQSPSDPLITRVLQICLQVACLVIPVPTHTSGSSSGSGHSKKESDGGGDGGGNHGLNGLQEGKESMEQVVLQAAKAYAKLLSIVSTNTSTHTSTNTSSSTNTSHTTPPKGVLLIPAEYFLTFLSNHITYLVGNHYVPYGSMGQYEGYCSADPAIGCLVTCLVHTIFKVLVVDHTSTTTSEGRRQQFLFYLVSYVIQGLEHTTQELHHTPLPATLPATLRQCKSYLLYIATYLKACDTSTYSPVTSGSGMDHTHHALYPVYTTLWPVLQTLYQHLHTQITSSLHPHHSSMTSSSYLPLYDEVMKHVFLVYKQLLVTIQLLIPSSTSTVLTQASPVLVSSSLEWILQWCMTMKEYILLALPCSTMSYLPAVFALSSVWYDTVHALLVYYTSLPSTMTSSNIRTLIQDMLLSFLDSVTEIVSTHTTTTMITTTTNQQERIILKGYDNEVYEQYGLLLKGYFESPTARLLLVQAYGHTLSTTTTHPPPASSQAPQGLEHAFQLFKALLLTSTTSTTTTSTSTTFYYVSEDTIKTICAVFETWYLPPLIHTEHEPSSSSSLGVPTDALSVYLFPHSLSILTALFQLLLYRMTTTTNTSITSMMFGGKSTGSGNGTGGSNATSTMGNIHHAVIDCIQSISWVIQSYAVAHQQPYLQTIYTNLCITILPTEIFVTTDAKEQCVQLLVAYHEQPNNPILKRRGRAMLLDLYKICQKESTLDTLVAYTDIFLNR